MNPASPRCAPIALWLCLACATPAFAQVSITYSVPGVSIGLNLGGYPVLQRIPGYPVYYAPGVNANYFFYDGMYWLFDGDAWYASSWYNGPWGRVDPFYVPDFILRVPVRYYRHAPRYFAGWRADAPPRWGEHWGRSWQERRRDWDRWDRKRAPAPAPLPAYQREFRGDRYPDDQRQQELRSRNYRYQPRDPVAREHYRPRQEQARPRREEQPRTANEAQRAREMREQKRDQDRIYRREVELGSGG